MQEQDKGAWVWIALIVLLFFMRTKGCDNPLAPAKITAATYVYEQRNGAVPNAVLDAIDQLNKLGIEADSVDVDTVDGEGQVPDQYKVPFQAATELGLPAMIFTAGDAVVKGIKDPKTTEAVLEVVK
jgi:hypothetical protein